MRHLSDGRSDEDPEHDHREQSVGLRRPESAPSAGDRLREWVEWFGVTRLVTSALAVVVVCAGAWFLVRTPPPPSEASLPVATSRSPASAPTVTLLANESPAPTTAGANTLFVHVAGAVASPGVYELQSGSRVDDAVRFAGGVLKRADPGQLNLAQPLVDGDRVYVPEEGEDVPPPVPASAAVSGGTAAPTGPVDVNRAGTVELETLPGIGPATASAIITERDLNGPFASFEDLERVPGIGPAKLAALTGLVVT